MVGTGSRPPTTYEEARAADELFWQAQEAAIQGATGQPCCTLSGIATGLANMGGDFAVVIHGEEECASSFRHLGQAAHRFYCTGLQERHLISGSTREPLLRCLRLLAQERRPEVIFVLGSCPLEVIGDPFEQAVQEAQDQFPDLTFVPLRTSGMKVGSQAAMLDWFFSTLAGSPPKKPKATASRRIQRGDPAQAPNPERCLNLLGLPRRRDRHPAPPECVDVLGGIGLEIVADYPYAVDLCDWAAIRFAPHTFVVDPSLYPRLVADLQAAGQSVTPVPLPVGVGDTERFYRAVFRAFDEEGRLDECIGRAKAEAEARIARFRARHAGLRLALGLRMLNNYASDQLAFQGLADYRCLRELGFDITLLVQGPPERSEDFKALFAQHDIVEPFEVFPEPWTISRYLDRSRYDLAYLANHCREEAAKAGVPMIACRSLEPWFAGILPNLDFLEQALR